MASTTSATLQELIQATIGAARVVKSQGAQLVDFITHRPGIGAQTFPIYDAEVFASVAEGTDLTATAFDTTAITITPGERGLMTELTDIARLRAGMQAAVDIGEVMGVARKALLNQEIYALFDGFSVTDGSGGSNITEALIQSTVATLRAAQAPGRLYLACTPWVYLDILKIYSPTTKHLAEEMQRSVLFDGVLPMIHGVTPLLIDNLIVGTGTGEMNEADTKTAIFSEFALGYVEEWDFKIENQRNASLRADELVATASYGVGEIKDSWGVELTVDNKD